MRKYFYGNKYMLKKIVGISLAVLGLLIFIITMSAKFLLIIIGLGLIVTGILLYMK